MFSNFVTLPVAHLLGTICFSFYFVVTVQTILHNSVHTVFFLVISSTCVDRSTDVDRTPVRSSAEFF